MSTVDKEACSKMSAHVHSLQAAVSVHAELMCNQQHEWLSLQQWSVPSSGPWRPSKIRVRSSLLCTVQHDVRVKSASISLMHAR